MKMNKIVQIGNGMGSGDIVEAVARDTIESIIANADMTDCWKMAYKAQNPGYQDGICCICLITGEIKSFAMSQNSRNQAIDNSYIELARVGQNEDDPFDVEPEDMEDYIQDHIDKHSDGEEGAKKEWPGLDLETGDWNSENARDANEEMWEELYDLQHEQNELCWNTNDDFDWEHINEELDAHYDIDEDKEEKIEYNITLGTYHNLTIFRFGKDEDGTIWIKYEDGTECELDDFEDISYPLYTADYWTDQYEIKDYEKLIEWLD